MEYALPELLSREDILRILKQVSYVIQEYFTNNKLLTPQRQLHVYNMNELTHDELLRVYKTFVMPLSQRPERTKKIKLNGMVTKNEAFEDQNMQVENVNNLCTSMEVDFSYEASCKVSLLIPNERMTSPVCEKRRQRNSDEDTLDMCEDDYQYQLSSVTKRIKINSLS